MDSTASTPAGLAILKKCDGHTIIMYVLTCVLLYQYNFPVSYRLGLPSLYSLGYQLQVQGHHQGPTGRT